uniref:Uncharacterized protein n=1 Tax=Microcebus murinus TaxID=30608 RepID=A0A8C5W0Q7_MICMU
MWLAVRSHMGEGVEEWVRLEGAFSLGCEQLCAGGFAAGGGGSLPGLVLSPGPVWVWDWPPPFAPAPTPAVRGFSSLPCLLRGGARGSLGVSMTTLCVWEGQTWGLPARGPFLGDHLSMSPT